MSATKREIENIMEWGWDNDIDVMNTDLGDLAEKYYFATRAKHSGDEKGAESFIENVANEEINHFKK